MSTSVNAQPDSTTEQTGSITTAEPIINVEPETAAKPTESESSPSNMDRSTYTGMAISATSNVATTASNAAAGVKDNVFSMFGGGAKKDKKEEDDTQQDRSGSSKAQKDAHAEDDEVDPHAQALGIALTHYMAGSTSRVRRRPLRARCTLDREGRN